MRKKFLLSLLSFLVVICSFGQVSVSIEVAPSLPLSGVALPNFTNVSQGGNEEVVIATLGAGLSVSGMVQYDLNETFFVGIEAAYFKSFEGSLEKYDVSGPGTLTTITFNAHALNLTPTVGFNINDRFYTKLGLVFALKQEVDVSTSIDNAAGITGIRKDVYEGTQKSIDIGVQTALGYHRGFGEKLSWFVELQFLNMVYKPARLVNTQNFDGLETDPTITFQKEIPFGSEEDNLELTFPIPFSSIGVGFGLKMKL